MKLFRSVFGLVFTILLTMLFAPMLMADETSPQLLVSFSEIMAMLPAWLVAITSVVTAATAITALTPNQADNEFLDKVLKFLNLLAGNFGKNKNADS